MNFRPLFLVLVHSLLLAGALPPGCTTCDRGSCPPSPLSCRGSYATDPCGCCRHCARQQWQPCGGHLWHLGYCDQGLHCAQARGTHLARIPEAGICKRLPSYYQMDKDENCPEVSGCNIRMSVCVCGRIHSCLHVFSYPNINVCRMHTIYEENRLETKSKCWDRGCNLIDGQCACQSQTCGVKYQFGDQVQCNEALVRVKCANVTCPVKERPTCPWDSVPSQSHTPAGHCCPTVPSVCTCDFNSCPRDCAENETKTFLHRGTGVPGRCCDTFACVPDPMSGRERENAIGRRRRLHPRFSLLEKTNRAGISE